jgi:hypothetical protein
VLGNSMANKISFKEADILGMSKSLMYSSKSVLKKGLKKSLAQVYRLF